jgi:hypothetical protein
MRVRVRVCIWGFALVGACVSHPVFVCVCGLCVCGLHLSECLRMRVRVSCVSILMFVCLFVCVCACVLIVCLLSFCLFVCKIGCLLED